MGTDRRPGATALAGLLLGVVVGLTACGAGGGDTSGLPSTRPSERAADRPASGAPEAPAPDRTTEPAETRPPTTGAVAPERTRTTRPTTAPETTTRPTTAAETTTRPTTAAETTTRPPTSPAATEPAPGRATLTAVPTRTSTPAAPAPAPTTTSASAAAAATAGVSQGLGALGWLLLTALAAALLVAGLLVARSQSRSAWDTEARALESETRTIATTRLPPVLSTTTTGRRSLVWPPVRADLVDAQSRWNALTDRASGEARQNWSLRVAGLLQELITAVDAENEGLATGRDWTGLRTRVDQAGRALSAILTVQPRPEPPPAGEPGPPALQT